jgi:hypothetical protein
MNFWHLSLTIYTEKKKEHDIHFCHAAILVCRVDLSSMTDKEYSVKNFKCMEGEDIVKIKSDWEPWFPGLTLKTVLN